ncbi:MAG: methyltransferase domain-containing protein [Candidatus Omnitrophica bacterium]|nr:methyltransferase domain-containing protein [Candidatus Omnitrophota bacterium]
MYKKIVFFNKLAHSWDIKHNSKDYLNMLLRHSSLYGIRKGEKILEVGCGTGNMFGILTKRVGKKGRVLAVDASSCMIEYAKRKFQRYRKNFFVADAANLPFKAGYFDRVIYFSSFPHFKDKLSALKEAGRVLKVGGYLIISHTASSRKIASIHKRAGGPVFNDRLPSKRKLYNMLAKTGFQVLCYRNQKKLYLLKARKINIQ